MKTCKEKALEWNVSPRSVNDMCKKGRIQGAIKEKGSWLIPDDSPKPMDGRVSNGKYIKKNMVAKAEVKSLPIGISDYVRAQEEYYYVDKTLLIKEQSIICMQLAKCFKFLWIQLFAEMLEEQKVKWMHVLRIRREEFIPTIRK